MYDDFHVFLQDRIITITRTTDFSAYNSIHSNVSTTTCSYLGIATSITVTGRNAGLGEHSIHLATANIDLSSVNSS